MCDEKSEKVRKEYLRDFSAHKSFGTPVGSHQKPCILLRRMFIADIGGSIRNAVGSGPEINISTRGMYNQKYDPVQREILNSLYERKKKREIGSVEYRIDCSLKGERQAKLEHGMSQMIKGFRSRPMVAEVGQGLPVKKWKIPTRRNGAISSQDFIAVLWSTACRNSEASGSAKHTFGLIPDRGRNWPSPQVLRILQQALRKKGGGDAVRISPWR